MPGPANRPFFQVPRVAHLPLIHRKNSNFFEPDKIVILHKLIFYRLIRGAFVTLPRRKGPVPGPQPGPPVRLGFPVWPPQWPRPYSPPPGFLWRAPAAPASATGPTRRLSCKLRPCKLPWQAADPSPNARTHPRFSLIRVIERPFLLPLPLAGEGWGGGPCSKSVPWHCPLPDPPPQAGEGTKTESTGRNRLSADEPNCRTCSRIDHKLQFGNVGSQDHRGR
jgi:hypothetical protein